MFALFDLLGAFFASRLAGLPDRRLYRPCRARSALELLSGTMELTVAGSQRTLGPGDFAVVPTGVPQGLAQRRRGELHYVLELDLQGPGCLPRHRSVTKTG